MTLVVGLLVRFRPWMAAMNAAILETIDPKRWSLSFARRRL